MRITVRFDGGHVQTTEAHRETLPRVVFGRYFAAARIEAEDGLLTHRVDVAHMQAVVAERERQNRRIAARAREVAR